MRSNRKTRKLLGRSYRYDGFIIYVGRPFMSRWRRWHGVPDWRQVTVVLDEDLLCKPCVVEVGRRFVKLFGKTMVSRVDTQYGHIVLILLASVVKDKDQRAQMAAEIWNQLGDHSKVSHAATAAN